MFKSILYSRIFIILIVLTSFLFPNLFSKSKTPFVKAVANLCPAAEACPYPGQPGLLWSCHPGDGDGTVSESLCNLAGRVETCGVDTSGQPKKWCCPVAGGSWTTNMAGCPTSTPTPTPVPTPTPNSTPWDVNQDGTVNIIDVGLIIDYYGDNPPLDRRTDVNGDGSVTLVDLGIVIDHYGF